MQGTRGAKKKSHRPRPYALPTDTFLLIMEGMPMLYVFRIPTCSSAVITIRDAARLAESARVSYDGVVVEVRVRRKDPGQRGTIPIALSLT